MEEVSYIIVTYQVLTVHIFMSLSTLSHIKGAWVDIYRTVFWLLKDAQ